MVRALERPNFDPTYLDFFGLQRPPFARLSNPSEVFHTEQYSLLMAHLANATEQPDCLVAICGVDGCGKSTLLNRYISSLGNDVCFARIDESCTGKKQFYSGVLRQLGFGSITGKPDELQRITKEFLVSRGMAGEPVLLIIDNAHLIHPNVLDQLRWLAAIKVDDTRVLSSILAGNTDLVRVMDSPAMSQLAFRSYICFHVRAFTEDETANYVWHRLKLAGGVDSVKFSTEAHPLIHRYTGGIPRLINILCNAVLTEARARGTSVVADDLLRTVAENRQLVPHVLPHQGKGRRKTDPDFKLVQQGRENCVEEPINDTDDQQPVAQPNKQDARRSGHETTNGDLMNLLQQVSGLSEEVGELKADRNRALEDVGTRDMEINDLRKQLEAQSAEAGGLARTLGDNTDEIRRLNQALSDSSTALHESDKAATQLVADLDKEKLASNTAETGLAEANARTEKLGQLEVELQDAAKTLAGSNGEVDRLQCLLSDAVEANDNLIDDLKLANGRLVEIDTLEKSTADFRDNIEKKVGELHSFQRKLEVKDEELDSEKQAREDEISRRQSIERDLLASQEKIATLEEQLGAEKETRKEEPRRLKGIENDLLANQEKSASLEKELDGEKRARDEELGRLKSCKNDLLASREKSASLEEELDDEKRAREDELSRLKSIENDLLTNQEKIASLEKELESGDGGLEDAERVSTLESELQDAALRLAESQAQLAENAELIAQLEIELGDLPKLDDQPSTRPLASTWDAAAKQRTAITTFEIIEKGQVERVIRFQEGQRRIMIGRSEDNDLYLDGKSVSRHHALIQYTDHGPYIEDLNSLNGTLVNSKLITKCDLRIGDIVTIGAYKIMPGPA